MEHIGAAILLAGAFGLGLLSGLVLVPRLAWHGVERELRKAKQTLALAGREHANATAKQKHAAELEARVVQALQVYARSKEIQDLLEHESKVVQLAQKKPPTP